MSIKGLLLPIFSLPSKYGIGDFGKEAFSFIKILKKNGFNTWQILPLNPIGFANSPYQSYSSFAFEDLYISLDDLFSKGLITKPISFNENKEHIDYIKVRSIKEIYYQEAFTNYSKTNGFGELDKFALANKEISQYAFYMSEKRMNFIASWNKWTIYQDERFNKLYHYHLFKQMILLNEWKKLKKFANDNGIQIMGDLPFYVSYDSSDVYFNRQYFELDQNFNPTLVAGVPPDYFSSTGQRWGNPIYNFKALSEKNYDFLIHRIIYSSSLYDILRLDHFRAFDTYYAIPSYCVDAKIGEWRFAPGYEIFDMIFKEKESIHLVAEDLGLLREEVYTLRDHYHLPGMNILQFNIFDIMKRKSLNLEDFDNVITYIGTHDNDTLKGFIKSFKKSQKLQLMNYFMKLDLKLSSLEEMFIEYSFKYFNDVIISFTDLMLLGSSYRINKPSTVNNLNWSVKLVDFTLLNKALKKGFHHV